MQIIGGKVSFKRSYQPEQYGSKGAEVELSFSLAEGEPFGAQLDDVAKLVKTKVLQLCNIKTEALGNAPADVKNAGALEGVAVETAVKPDKVKPTRTKADLEADATAKLGGKPGPKSEAAPSASANQAAQEPADDLEGFDEDAVPAREIPDTELSSAMNRVVGVLKTKHGTAAPGMVRDLIQTFKPSTVAKETVFKSGMIPQNMRAEFLRKLEELK